MIRVAVVDDQALVRSAFALLLRTAGDLEVVGEAGDGLAAVSLVARTAPDVVLMDIRMPGVDGLEATRRILADPAARTKVLVLTTFDDDDYVFAALRAGASGFLVKDVEPQVLLDAVRTVAAGEALLAPRATRRLIEEYLAQPSAPAGPPPPGLASLTDRERQVLRTLARGASNAEIATELHLSYGTVKTHVSHLLTKLEARDRSQLVVIAYESGMVRGCCDESDR